MWRQLHRVSNTPTADKHRDSRREGRVQGEPAAALRTSPGRRQGTEEDRASRRSGTGEAGGADDGGPRIPEDVDKLARQRRAFLGEVVWESFQTEGATGKERLKQKDMSVEMVE